jgi:hypothetical protein
MKPRNELKLGPAERHARLSGRRDIWLVGRPKTACTAQPQVAMGPARCWASLGAWWPERDRRGARAREGVRVAVM